MNCPCCGSKVEPWRWGDGGYRGVRCVRCGKAWQSGDFQRAAFDAETAAVATLIAGLGFPADAIEC